MPYESLAFRYVTIFEFPGLIIMFDKYQKHILLSFYLMLGFIFQFPSVAMRFWLIEKVKLSPAQLMAMGGLASIPWCLKPVYGFISDSCPIFGYRRKPFGQSAAKQRELSCKPNVHQRGPLCKLDLTTLIDSQAVDGLGTFE